MDNITESVRKAIQENLPATVADELKSFIEEAQVAKRHLAQAMVDKTNANQQYRETAALLNAADRELSIFRGREAEFKASEQKVQTANLNEQVARATLNGAMEVTRLVFQNTMVKRSFLDNVNKQVPVASGNYTQPVTESHSVTETIEGQ